MQCANTQNAMFKYPKCNAQIPKMQCANTQNAMRGANKTIEHLPYNFCHELATF
jgi:hypothetical protein